MGPSWTSCRAPPLTRAGRHRTFREYSPAALFTDCSLRLWIDAQSWYTAWEATADLGLDNGGKDFCFQQAWQNPCGPVRRPPCNEHME